MPTTIDVADITDGTMTGAGSFDLFAKAMSNHLRSEYDAGRLNGSDYANVYVGAIQNALSQSIQFELSRVQAGFAADLTEEQVQTQVNQTDNVLAQTEVTRERGGFR